MEDVRGKGCGGGWDWGCVVGKEKVMAVFAFPVGKEMEVAPPSPVCRFPLLAALSD
jgi:hypothetical protein